MFCFSSRKHLGACRRRTLTACRRARSEGALKCASSGHLLTLRPSGTRCGPSAFAGGTLRRRKKQVPAELVDCWVRRAAHTARRTSRGHRRLQHTRPERGPFFCFAFGARRRRPPRGPRWIPQGSSRTGPRRSACLRTFGSDLHADGMRRDICEREKGSALDPAASVETAGVRDVWAREDAGEASGRTFKTTVAPMDSVFVVLTPK